jgi:CubicO group peptidase (beta-lactamase class C family)
MEPRRLAAFLLALLLLLAIPSRADARSGDDATTAELEAIRAKAGVPALGAGIVTSAGLEGAWATGKRAAGRDEAVTVEDRWHLGSCTKSMTATLVALLVERGDVAWELKLPDLLPDVADSMHDDWGDVTLVELACHRAGAPAELDRDGLWQRCWKREGTFVEQRRLLTKTVLGWKPVHAPTTKFLYSNAGIAIAGHVAETAAAKPYEELMQELLFRPLGIQSADFGAPGDPAKPEVVSQPRGHLPDGRAVAPGPAADNPPAIAPAGTCAMSLADWGRYLALHLRGAKGDVKVGEITLHADTMKKLHTAYPAADGDRYAMGWVVAQRDWAGGDGTTWWHSGSNTMWYCVAWLAPAADFAVFATCNAGGPAGQKATDAAVSMLVQEHAARAKPRAGAGN